MLTLRVCTAGSVDDGKSTLIGRLLFDTKSLLDDQLEQARADAEVRGGEVDLAQFTDGLRAEREQGITIDVAHRYLTTPARKIIIADAPGHEQYTRNMATGCSTADVLVLLVDALRGVVTQSRRHAFVAALLGVPHLVVAVNKMDAVSYDRAVFARIDAELRSMATALGFSTVDVVPLSAKSGGNVVHRAPSMRWYEGPTLLELLERAEPPRPPSSQPFRLPVQLVVSHGASFRGIAGRIVTGTVRVGDAVRVLGPGRSAVVRRIVTYDGDLAEARAPSSVMLLLADEIDVSRGDMVVAEASPPQVATRVEADVVWLGERPLDRGRELLLRVGAQLVRARIDAVCHRVDVDTLERGPSTTLAQNDVGRLRLSLAQDVYFDAHERNRLTAGCLLIDAVTNETMAGGLLRTATVAARPAGGLQRASIVLVEGAGGAAEVLAGEVASRLVSAGVPALSRTGAAAGVGLAAAWLVDAGVTPVIVADAQTEAQLVAAGLGGGLLRLGAPADESAVRRLLDAVVADRD